MSITIAIGKDEASGAVARVHEMLTAPEKKRELMDVIGQKAGEELGGWFRRRDQTSPNKQGWPRQHFWNRIAEATKYDSSKTTESTATVVVSEPALAAKINGATIKPTQGRQALAIPMHPDAYGVRPGPKENSPITGLFVFRSTRTGGAFLVRKEGEGKTANLTFYYRLVSQVTVPKDPQALPPVKDIGDVLGKTALSFFRRNTGGTL